MELSDTALGRLNACQVGFFVLTGLANLFFAHSFPARVWINFNLLGGLEWMPASVVVQSMVLAGHPDQENRL